MVLAGVRKIKKFIAKRGLVLIGSLLLNILEAEYFPLASDRMWVYEVKKGFNFGDTILLVETTYIETCRALPANKGGLSVYLYSIKPETVYYSNTPNEILELRSDIEKEFDTVLACTLAKLPIIVGDTWHYLLYPRSEVGLVIVVADTEETVVTPAGTFICVRLDFYSYKERVVRRLWLADGVGIIKDEFPRVWLCKTLVDYK